MQQQHELARRLERAEAKANAAFVTARAQLHPEVGAAWIEVAGAHAMFDGAESPVTQTFGIGMFDPFLEREYERVETFFRDRGAPTFHEVCELAAPSTTQLLERRGYRPIEHSVVLTRDTRADGMASNPGIVVRLLGPVEGELWAKTSARAWGSESADLAAFVEALGLISTRTQGFHSFLAEIDGVPAAAGALNIQNGVAILAGASTVPEFRRRGAQQALLQHRLAFAAARGIDTAMVVTQPDSGSQRNAERRGFVRAYTRTKWQNDVAS